MVIKTVWNVSVPEMLTGSMQVCFVSGEWSNSGRWCGIGLPKCGVPDLILSEWD